MMAVRLDRARVGSRLSNRAALFLIPGGSLKTWKQLHERRYIRAKAIYAQKTSGLRHRWGIKTKLIAAFGVVAGTTVTASAIGILFHDMMYEQFVQISEDSLPALSHALDLAEDSAVLKGNLEALMVSKSNSEWDRRSQAVQRLIDEVREHIGDIAHRWEQLDEERRPAVATKLRRILQEINPDLFSALDQSLRSRVKLGGRVQLALDAIHAGHEELHAALHAGAGDAEAAPEVYVDLDSGSRVQPLLAASSLKAEINLALAIFAEVPQSDNPDEPEPLKQRFGDTEAAIIAARAKLDASAPGRVSAETLDAFLAHGSGEDNIFDLRMAELAEFERGYQLLADQWIVIDHLASLVRDHAKASKENVNEMSSRVKTMIFKNKQLFLVLASLSLAVAEAAMGSTDIAQNISGVGDTAQDTLKAVREAQNTATELAHMATQLQRFVERFKYRTRESSSGPVSTQDTVVELPAMGSATPH